MGSGIVGTWKLTDYFTVDPSGVARKFWGPDVVGYLMYSVDGYMCATLMKPGRANFAAQDPLMGTVEEKAHAAETYISYGGRYTIDGDKVTHHVEFSLFPNWVGMDQVRYFSVDGDELRLRTTPTKVGGDDVVVQVLWTRAR
jgi:hypothetical protein